MTSLRLLACAAFAAYCSTLFAQKLPLDAIRLPAGFSISVFATVPSARAMALGANGTVFVGSMRAGRVIALTVRDNRVIESRVIAAGLRMPVGVAFRQGSLYISDIDRILRLDESSASSPTRPVRSS